MLDFITFLRENPYPGRGILVRKPCLLFHNGRSATVATAYLPRLMTVSVLSKARSLPSFEDPSLIIYHPVRKLGDALVVTNGDQTGYHMDACAIFAGGL